MVLRWILTNKLLLIRVFWVLVILLLIGLAWLAQREYRLLWTEMGRLAARTAVIAYLITLIPGILKRLGSLTLLKPVQIVLMTFRRQIGIFSFLAAAHHFLFSYLLFRLPNMSMILPRVLEDWLGLLAYYLLFIMFITSNDWAQKHLGVWWHRLHRITHVIIWIVLTHVILKGNALYAGLITAVGMLSVLSFIYRWWKSRAKLSA